MLTCFKVPSSLVGIATEGGGRGDVHPPSQRRRFQRRMTLTAPDANRSGTKFEWPSDVTVVPLLLNKLQVKLLSQEANK